MIAGTIMLNTFFNNDFALLLTEGISPWSWDKETYKTTYSFILKPFEQSSEVRQFHEKCLEPVLLFLEKLSFLLLMICDSDVGNNGI